MEHVVYMTFKEFLSKKRQLPRGSKSGGGESCPQAPVNGRIKSLIWNKLCKPSVSQKLVNPV